MKHTAVNPYLPLDEYVPDGEPRLFEGRVYVYGSHDTAGGGFFCLEDYVAWSAPEDDLGDWRYEGVIYRKDQDPSNPDGRLELFAPDVVRGPDGRYYLYYCLRMRREFGVAVSDSPAGHFAIFKNRTARCWKTPCPTTPRCWWMTMGKFICITALPARCWGKNMVL